MTHRRGGATGQSFVDTAVACFEQGDAREQQSWLRALPLWPEAAAAAAGIRTGFERAQIVKLSDDELDFLTGRRDPAAVREELWHPGLKLAVLTMGGQGCILMTPRGERHVPSISVTPVDTTGAGDGFVAGLLAGLLAHDRFPDEAALAEICRFANAVGAITTTERGAIPSLPTRAAVEARLAGAPVGGGG